MVNSILPAASIKTALGKIDDILFNWLLKKFLDLCTFLISIFCNLLAFQFTSHNSIYFLKVKIKTSQDTTTDRDNPPLWAGRPFSKCVMSLSAGVLIEAAVMHRLCVDFLSRDHSALYTHLFWKHHLLGESCSSDYQPVPISRVEQAEQGQGQCNSLPVLGSLKILWTHSTFQKYFCCTIDERIIVWQWTKPEYVNGSCTNYFLEGPGVVTGNTKWKSFPIYNESNS